ncbi:MAG: tocopherol cyclase family protein [Clostridia bacterium]
MKNKELNYFNKIKYQEKYIGSNKKNYFEGWYFKHQIGDKCICIIPGISIVNKKEYAFIQVIDNITNKSYNIDYDIKYFKYNNNPFSIQIGNNYFSENKIILDIENSELKLKANVEYKNLTKITKSSYMPNIMGPFAYIPNMECNHCVISMFHNIRGNIVINNNDINFNNGIGYIEKDYGTSFPKEYIWMQASKILKSDEKISVFLAIADIPILKTNFKGLLCVILLNNIEYRFCTYNLSKITKYIIKENEVNIKIKNKKLNLSININLSNGNVLKSPKLGSMENTVNECLNSQCEIKLYKNEKCIISESFENVTSEIKVTK